MNLKDIARIAGVSITTVSRVVNNKHEGHMGIETYNKVKKIIEETKYKPHVLASGLRSGSTKVIALIIPDSSNPYFSQLSKSIEDECFLNNYGTFICNTNLDTKRGKYYLENLKRHNVAGMIICNYGFTEEDIEIIKDFNFILLGEKINDVICDYIGIDDFKGGYIAAEYLIKLGHRKIILLMGDDKFKASKDRLEGFLKCMEDNNLAINPKYIIKSQATFFECYKNIVKLLENNFEFSAIFTFNDMMALGAIKALNEKEIKIPDKISVLGYDNIFIDELINPSLTTIAISINALGKMAVQHLLKRITKKNNVERSNIILEPELIIRGSCDLFKEK